MRCEEVFSPKKYEIPENFAFYSNIAKALFDYLQEVYPGLKAKKVLELGSGTGIATREILKRFPFSKVVCVDISREMLKAAKKTLPDCLYIRADAGDLSFLREKFDLVIGNFCCHWFMGEGFLKELFNVLKDEGICAFSIPIDPCKSSFLRKVLKKIFVFLKKEGYASVYRTNSLKKTVELFDGMKKSWKIYEVKECYSAKKWLEVLKSRGSWSFMFAGMEDVAENFWQKLIKSEDSLDYTWSVVLLLLQKTGKKVKCKVCKSL